MDASTRIPFSVDTLPTVGGHGGERHGLWALLTLQPYGHRMSSPGVTAWVASARSVIALMALVEASIWGLIGTHLAAGADGWIKALIAAFAFVGIFLLIWIVDASFIMAERPLQKSARGARADPAGDSHRSALDAESPWPWRFGVGVRMLIVAISLLVTAPLLTLVIRGPEIEVEYQKRLAKAEETRGKQQSAMIQGRVQAETAKVLAELAPLLESRERLTKQIEGLKKEIAEPGGTFKGDIARIEAQIKGLEEDLEAEKNGTGGRPPGEGPQFRKLQGELRAARDKLRAVQAKAETAASATAETQRGDLKRLEGELSKLANDIAPLETQRAAAVAAASASVKDETDTKSKALELSLGLQWALLDRILADERAQRQALGGEQVTASEPSRERIQAVESDTWDAWLHGFYLTLIRPWLDGIAQHTRSVDGLAQAVLLILFFSLLALKLFEPKSVRLYYSDDLQLKWADYLRGLFDRVPGFAPGSNPATRMNHIEFARAYLDYRQDPSGFYNRHAERLTRQYKANEAAQQAVLSMSIADAMVTQEMASLETRYREREAERETERELRHEALHGELDRRAEQDNARFKAQLAAMEQRFAQMAEQRQAEAARQSKEWDLALQRMRLELERERSALEQARVDHKDTVARERAAWEDEQAAKRRELELKHRELAQRLDEQDREHARRLKELDNTHAQTMTRLRMEHQRSLYGDRVAALKGQASALDARKQSLDETAGGLTDELRELDRRAAELHTALKTRPERMAAAEAEIARLARQSGGFAQAIDQCPPEQAERLASLTDQKLAKDKAVAAQRAELQRLARAGDELEGELAALQQRRGELSASIAENRREVRECDDGQRLLRQRLLALGDNDEG